MVYPRVFLTSTTTLLFLSFFVHVSPSNMPHTLLVLVIISFLKNLFIWLCWLLVAGYRIFTASCGIICCGTKTLWLWRVGSVVAAQGFRSSVAYGILLVIPSWCFWIVVLEKTLESPLDCKEIQPVHPKGNQSWVFIGRTDAKAETPTLASWCEEMTPWKRPWCWEGLGERGEGDNRGWDGWMASLTRWMWVWVNSGSWWWTGRPGVLQFMGSQRVGHDWATELNWTRILAH